MDLVDEEHVSRLQIGEDGGQVAGPFQNRPRGGFDVYLHLAGDDMRQCGFAEAGGSAEQNVVNRIGALPGGLDQDAEVLLALRLPHVIV